MKTVIMRRLTTPKINCFYVHLAAAIPAEQHFGFGGRLSRRTDLRLLTFSFCYFFIFPFLLFLFFLFFVYCLLFVHYFSFILFLLFVILASPEVIIVVSSSVGWLAKFDDVLWFDNSGPTIPHLQALRICSTFMKSPFPVSVVFRIFNLIFFFFSFFIFFIFFYFFLFFLFIFFLVKFYFKFIIQCQ